MNFFITAIGTDCGKTFVSAIFCEALKANYWKPVQAGLPKDSDQIKNWCSDVLIHKETYFLNSPESPHAAAIKDGVTIDLKEFILPKNDNNLIIEGAGGLMVPLNEEALLIDLIDKLKLEVILVCNLYLGSINHSILTIEALQKRKISIRGIVFNGDGNEDSERIILKYANVPCLLKIKREPQINSDIVNYYAHELLKNMNL